MKSYQVRLKRCRISFYLITLVSCLLAMNFLACSGGGSGGGSDRTMATIDQGNGTQVATSAYTNGDFGYAFSGFTGLEADGDENISMPLLYTVSDVLLASLDKADIPNRDPGFSAKATQTVTMDNIAGDCGGTADMTISYDDQSGAFSATFTFNDYCYGETTLDGSATFTGTLNTNSENFENFSITFDELEGTTGTDSYQMDGTIDIDVEGSTTTLTMDMTIDNYGNELVYRVDDYTMAVVDYGAYEEISLAGDFYHPSHGWVTVSTVTALVHYVTDDYPSSGELMFVGDGNSSARFIVMSSTTFRVEVDADGDGTYEWVSTTQNWSDI